MYGKHKKINQQMNWESIDLPSSALARIELLFVNGFPMGAWAIRPYVEFETVIEPVMFFAAALPPPPGMYLLQKHAKNTFTLTHEQIHSGWCSLRGNCKPEELGSQPLGDELRLANVSRMKIWYKDSSTSFKFAILQRKTHGNSRAKICAESVQCLQDGFVWKQEFLWLIMRHHDIFAVIFITPWPELGGVGSRPAAQPTCVPDTSLMNRSCSCLVKIEVANGSHGRIGRFWNVLKHFRSLKVYKD